MDERLFALLAARLAGERPAGVGAGVAGGHTQAPGRVTRGRTGEHVVLANVVQARGATPRKAGSRMLVGANWTHGSVGGGAMEARVIDAARAVLRGERDEADVEIDLTGRPGAAGVCGGTMRVALRAWRDEAGAPHAHAIGGPAPNAGRLASEPPTDRAPDARTARAIAEAPDAHTARAIAEAPDAHTARAIADAPDAHTARAIAGAPDAHTARAIAGAPDARTARAIADALSRGQRVAWHSEVLEPDPRLLIVGGGHCAEALDAMAALLEFDRWVFDERAACFDGGAFAGATTRSGDYARLADAFDTERAVYAVLLNRDFASDVATLRVLAGRPLAYLGMMGSRKRIAEVLAAVGEVPGLVAPVGLEIGAETPAEIAVSILAQVIAARRAARAPG